MKCFVSLALCLSASLACHASTVTLGPAGINSTGLLDFAGNPLNGAGISIGQFESFRPGDPDFDTDGALFNLRIDPAQVFYRTTSSIDATADEDTEVSEHAVQVAGVIISSDNTDPDSDGDSPTGVAPGASLYSVGFNFETTLQQDAAVAAQRLITTVSSLPSPVKPLRVINGSFVVPTATSGLTDGNQLLTQFVDWSASEHDILYVMANRNSGTAATLAIPSDNFNGITVARSAQDFEDNVYRRVSMNNDYSHDAAGARTSVDIIAPGDNVKLATWGSNTTPPPFPSGSSFAAPHVTGTAALLQQYAEERIAANAPNWTNEARHHEVMKAVIMNSADKIQDTGNGKYLGMTRTVLDQMGNDWLQSEAYGTLASQTIPLDDQMGTGHLNASRAVTQFSTPRNPDSFTGQLIGWDYDTVGFPGQAEVYQFQGANQLEAGTMISATLVWDRRVAFDADGGFPNRFDAGDTFEPYFNLDEC